jgi:hypothetical protein
MDTKWIRCLGVFWLAFVVALPALGAESGERESENEEEEELPRLPEPLDYITGNYTDLEKSGHFKIISGKVGRTRELDEEALIWTLKVVKPLTCKHAQLLLRNVGDVRFYRTHKDKRWYKELMMAKLHYSASVNYGAVLQDKLNRDEHFQVWVLLTPVQMEMLRIEKATRVIFRERQAKD